MIRGDGAIVPVTVHGEVERNADGQVMLSRYRSGHHRAQAR